MSKKNELVEIALPEDARIDATELAKTYFALYKTNRQDGMDYMSQLRRLIGAQAALCVLQMAMAMSLENLGGVIKQATNQQEKQELQENGHDQD